MNRLYLVNVLGNLHLPLLFECFHCFDVSVFAMSASRTISFQEVKCSVLKWVQVSSISSCSHIHLVDGNEFTSILAVLGVSACTWWRSKVETTHKCLLCKCAEHSTASNMTTERNVICAILKYNWSRFHFKSQATSHITLCWVHMPIGVQRQAKKFMIWYGTCSLPWVFTESSSSLATVFSSVVVDGWFWGEFESSLQWMLCKWAGECRLGVWHGDNTIWNLGHCSWRHISWLLGIHNQEWFQGLLPGTYHLLQHWKNEVVNSTTSAELLSKSILIIWARRCS